MERSKVAVVGSGPAGLCCAGELARAGIKVVIFEALHKTGGVLRYGIPPFRIPGNILDLEIELKIKSITGRQDQGGGPIWRAKDAKNYYVARWNPLENNLRVYYVRDGRRVQLASADIITDPGEWHEIEIKHVGNIIRAKFDYEKVIEIEDTTFTESGMAGLWTKADAATAFDDFKVEIKDENDDADGNDDNDEDKNDDDIEDDENDDENEK